MKLQFPREHVVACALLISFAAFPGRVISSAPQTAPPRHTVVVELFTSEGCSTCPPADALLEKLQTTQPVAGVQVIALEEHVDYWNAQGWVDPYSSPEWTARQQQYVAKLKEKGPYTPQMVVDGQKQLVGSHELEARQAVQESANRATTDVTLTTETSGVDGTQQVQVNVGKLIGTSDKDTADVWLAVTEKDLGSAVQSGENAGQNLHHAPVLRLLRKIGVATLSGQATSSFAGSARIKFKAAWKQENLQVVVFVQERKSWRILGAAASGVKN